MHQILLDSTTDQITNFISSIQFVGNLNTGKMLTMLAEMMLTQDTTETLAKVTADKDYKAAGKSFLATAEILDNICKWGLDDESKNQNGQPAVLGMVSPFGETLVERWNMGTGQEELGLFYLKPKVKSVVEVDENGTVLEFSEKKREKRRET